MATLDDDPSPVATPAKAAPWSWGRAAGAAEAAEFAEHLAGLTRSGLPLPSGLRALAAELPSRRLRPALRAMADRVERGEPLDEATAGLSARFPAPLRGLLVAGARSGALADLLTEYVRYARLGADLRRAFWRAVAYPLFLLAAVLGLFVFASVWVVDAFRSILGNFGMEVPPLTQALFWIAEATTARGPSIAALTLVLGGIGFAVLRLAMGPAERRMLATNIPLYGPLLRWGGLAEFCHLAATLVEAERPLPEALDLAGRGVGDAELARAGATLRASVEAGIPLDAALAAWARCPAGLAEVLGDSPLRGGLAESLHHAGEMFEARARTQATFASASVGAVALVAVIWGIGFVVVGLYMPIWELFRRFFY